MKKYRIFSLFLALTVVVLSVPLVVSKANDVDTNTITEYVDKDGDGYVDVDSLYSDFPVTSQTVTDEGIIVTCFDAPQTYADATSNWYYDKVIIGVGNGSSSFMPFRTFEVVEGPFRGAISVTFPSNSIYNSGSNYYYGVYFVNDLLTDTFVQDVNYTIENTVVCYSETNTSTYFYHNARQGTGVGTPIGAGTFTFMDNIASYTGTFEYNHSYYNSYLENVVAISFKCTSAPRTYDFSAYCNATITDLSGFEVEVDSGQ